MIKKHSIFIISTLKSFPSRYFFNSQTTPESKSAMDRRCAAFTTTRRRSLKRKLETDFVDETLENEPRLKSSAAETDPQDRLLQIRGHVSVLESCLSASESDRAAAKDAARAIVELAREEENLNDIVDCGAVPALVRLLRLPTLSPEEDGSKFSVPHEFEVEKECAFALNLIAVKSDYQQLVVDAGCLRPLIELVKTHKSSRGSGGAVDGVIRRAADAICSISHENSNIKNLVRAEGGIPPLVELLNFFDTKVQKAAAGALKILAFKNDGNKNQIVECNALPNLVLMLRSEIATMIYEAVGVIGNLVHSSPSIKKLVLNAGALQPVIDLLSSPCVESQREAALLLGQFATADSDCKAHIVQRGAVQPLINMLQSPDAQVKEMSAFAIGRLAQDTHNQAGIAHSGGILPLLKLLDSKNESLQHNAAFSLYGLADNEDNIAALIKYGLVQKFQDGEFLVQRTKDCVEKTLKRLEEKICGRVLNNLLYLMRVAEKAVKNRVALAFAHLCKAVDRQVIFIEHKGLELLLGLLESKILKEQRYGSLALHELATKTTPLSHVNAVPPSPNSQVYLGEQYINNPTLSDITFLVDGKQFYAHKICLLASSEAFRAMFDGGYRERHAKDVDIPNIRWDIFELMMRYIYTGLVDVDLDIAHDLLEAADQYLLEGLKCQCEHAIAQDICVENVSMMFDLSEAYNATSLKQACILFVLEHFDNLSKKPWYHPLMKRIIPEIRNFFIKSLAKPNQGSLLQAEAA